MKTRRARILSAALALVIGAAMAIPVHAVAAVTPKYDNAKQLFSQQFQGDEGVTNREAKIKYDPLTGATDATLETTQDLYQRRIASASITISSDMTVGENFMIDIPKGETLTIEKGATLTIYGVLSLNGKLVNNGTLIIGNKSKAVAENKTATLDSRGRVTNNGTVEIRCGTFVNNTIAKFDNKGTVNITNKIKGYRALNNLARQSGEKIKAGEITNTGKIYVKNTEGIGINNEKNAVFNNEGEIFRTAAGSTQGKITGNKVKVTE